MFGWLKDAWNWVTGIPNDIKNWFMSIINAFASQVFGAFQDVWNWLGTFVHWIEGGFNALWRYVTDAWNYLVNFVEHTIPQAFDWVWRELKLLASWASDIVKFIVNEVQKLYNYILQQFSDLYKWIIQNIWDPLYALASDALRWVETYGFWLYNLISDPARLAAYIGQYLLGAWISLLHRFAAPIGRWLARSMMAAGSEVGSIIEDVISAIL